MIFVTLGTTHMPFDRLVRGLATLPAEEIVIQHGPAKPPEGVRRAEPFLDFGEMEQLMQEADAVVTHAGVGTVLVAIRHGHKPIVVPRFKGETVDDHQVELCRTLGERGSVVPIYDVSELPAAVAAAQRGDPPDLDAEKPIHVALRAALHRR